MQQSPYSDMAREFMDLWQKQVASTMGDKQFIQAMLEMLQTMQPAKTHATKAHSANPSDAPGAEPGLLAELAFRLAMCEKRIAALEGGRDTQRKKPATGSKKPRG